MRRKSLAEIFYEETSEEDGEEGAWLVLYDFRSAHASEREDFYVHVRVFVCL